MGEVLRRLFCAFVAILSVGQLIDVVDSLKTPRVKRGPNDPLWGAIGWGVIMVFVGLEAAALAVNIPGPLSWLMGLFGGQTSN